MKLTFKVCVAASSLPPTFLPLLFLHILIPISQDLKQQKFEIHAEPSELVRIPLYLYSTYLRQYPAVDLRHITVVLTLSADFCCEGEDSS